MNKTINLVTETPAQSEAPAETAAAVLDAPEVEEVETPPEPNDELTQQNASESEDAPTSETPTTEVEAVQPEGDPAETLDLPASPSDEAAKPAPVLTKLRELDASLFSGDAPDEGKIVAEISQGRTARGTLGYMGKLADKDPEFNLAVLRALKRDGQKLNQAQEEILAKAPPPPKPVYEVPKEAAAEYRRLLTAGKFEEAAAYQTEHIIMPRLRAENEAALQKDAATRTETQRAEGEKAEEARVFGTLRQQMLPLAKRFSSLFKANPDSPYGVDFIGKHGAMLREDMRTMAPTMEELAVIALQRRGWLKGSKKPAPATTTKTVQSNKPGIRAVTPAGGGSKGPAPAGVWRKRINVVEAK